MPLDTRIPLGVQPPQINNPAERMLTLRNLAQQQQGQDLAIQQRQRQMAAEDQQAQTAGEVAQAWPQLTSVDRAAVLASMRPEARMLAEKTLAEWDEQRAKGQKAKADVELADRKRRAALARGVQALGNDPEAARIAFSLEAEEDPAVAGLWEQLGADPSKLPQIIDYFVRQDPDFKAPEPKTRVVKTRNADGTETEQIVADTPGQTFTSAPEAPKDLEAAIFAASKAGDAKELRRLLNLKASSAAAGRDPNANAGPQPGWQWVVREGKEVYTNRVQAGDTPQNARVKATEDERKTAGFYGQMSDAIRILDELESKLTEPELYQIQTLPQEGLIGMANRGELSEHAKRYLRAFEQFTESRLRPVSGAAIADTEYARDRRTYAKQFAETPKLAEDRKRARSGALEALRKRAGVAIDDTSKASPSAAPAPAGPITVQTPDGQTFTFPNQAQADAFKKRAGL